MGVLAAIDQARINAIGKATVSAPCRRETHAPMVPNTTQNSAITGSAENSNPSCVGIAIITAAKVIKNTSRTKTRCHQGARYAIHVSAAINGTAPNIKTAITPHRGPTGIKADP